jgi:two-component system response regulator TtrR
MQAISPSHLNLYVVDDDKDVRESLSLLFVARRYRVQAFESGEAFLEGADLAQPGCVVLDIRMGGISGLQVFDELRRVASPLVVILLSTYLDVPIATSYTKKGAFDCLVKPHDESLLVERVGLAMQHASDTAAELIAKGKVKLRWETLTPREKDVARLVRLGWKNNLIADELKIGVRAVETHRLNGFSKMWANNNVELGDMMRDHDID